MFNIFKPKPTNKDLKTVTLKLSGLHCTSCAVNIDLSLEDLPEVSSKTNYAKSETVISYNPEKSSIKDIKKIITDLGYQIV